MVLWSVFYCENDFHPPKHAAPDISPCLPKCLTMHQIWHKNGSPRILYFVQKFLIKPKVLGAILPPHSS